MPSPLISTQKFPEKQAGAPLSEFELESIDLFVGSIQLLGLPRSIGEIYGFLFAQAQPQPMEVLVRRLGISVGSASQGLKLLKSIGAVKVTLHPGDRREFFAAQTELRKLIAGVIKERIQPHLDNADARVELMLQSSRKLPTGDRALLQGRVDLLRSWKRKAGDVLPYVVRFLAH